MGGLNMNHYSRSKTHRRRSRRGRKRVVSMIPQICIVIATFALAVTAVILIRNWSQDLLALFPKSITNSSESDIDWDLVLINKWNPIESVPEIDLITLSNGKQVHARIYPDLQDMFDAARNEGVYPTVISGFRTREKQQQLYDEKLAECKELGMSPEDAVIETESWVAPPSTSEHELGIAVDINGDGIDSTNEEVYQWLASNAHYYGFILRYPEGKTDITGISYEPWHYRYVGHAAAGEMYEQGLCLEEYL